MLEVIVYSFLGGVVSLLGGVLLISNSKTANAMAKYATPFAAGVLLSAAFTHLLPEALDGNDAKAILTTTLSGILGFFILERFLLFFHHHHEHKGKPKTPNSLIMIGDTLHNGLDGVAIAAGFLISPSAGIITTLAVALHEIPQEIGDFAIMLNNGMEKGKVILANLLSALATIITAVITFSIGDSDSAVIPFLLALTAGFFIYIATSDIIPEIHDSVTSSRDIRPWLLIAGALFLIWSSPVVERFIEHSEAHSNVHEHSVNDQISP